MKTADKQEVSDAFYKYFNKSCSKKELQFLNAWILDNKYDQELRGLIDEFLSSNDLPDSGHMEHEEEIIWDQICVKIDVPGTQYTNGNGQTTVKRWVFWSFNGNSAHEADRTWC